MSILDVIKTTAGSGAGIGSIRCLSERTAAAEHATREGNREDGQISVCVFVLVCGRVCLSNCVCMTARVHVCM